MKRFLAAVLGLTLTASLFAGCSSNQSKDKASSTAPSAAASVASSAAPEAPAAPAEQGLSTGLAIVNAVGKSKDAGEADGLAQADSDVVAVLVDAEGRIVDCKINAVQTKIPFSKEGKLLLDKTTLFKNKQEMKEEYGLKKASGIGKEWNEQADALAAYVIGKTADEVKGIAMNEKTAPTDAELSASVTISIGGLTNVIVKAVENAVPMGAQAGDKLGLGTTTNMSKSKDAGDGDGVAQAYSMYGAASFDADGKITSCLLDGSQSNVNFDKTGKITTDLTVAPQSKNELGEAYGMKKASGIGKEWNEQAAAYAQYALGKTVSELTGLAVNDHGSPTDTELAASVTVSIGDFNACLQKAADIAK